MNIDVIVAGGSYAGMSAALQVARARRQVLVIDAGVRRNRFADAAHGLLGHDGRPPADIAADARAQLLAYPNVRWIDARATRAEPAGDGFRITTDGGETQEGRRLVLAMGVIDTLPEIPGLAERWGRHVFHCPYCHGYELDNGRLGVLATGEMAIHQALLVPDWGPTTLFTNGAFEPGAEQRAQLAARGVGIETARVREITGARANVCLDDGRRIELDGLFTAPRLHPAGPLAEQLGCELEDSPFGSFIRTDAMQATSVPNVFACGDAARATGSLPFAVADGAMAGAAAHRSLIFA